MVFGFFSKDEDRLVGAREKHQKAAERAELFKLREKEFATKKAQNPIIPVVLVFVLAVAFSFLLTDGALQGGIGLALGNTSLDKLLFGPGVPSLTGGIETDHSLTLVLRALIIFVLAGIAPFFANLFAKISDSVRMDPYVTVWGTNIVLAMVLCLGWDFVKAGLLAVAKALF